MKDTQIIIDHLVNTGLEEDFIKDPKWIDYPYKFEYTYTNIPTMGKISFTLNDTKLNYKKF